VVRDGAYQGFEPAPPRNGPYKVVSIALVWLDVTTGSIVHRRDLSRDEQHYWPTAAWPRTDGPGHLLVGSVFGKGPGPLAAFRMSLDSAGAPFRTDELSFRDTLFDNALRMDKRLSEVFMPLLVGALRRADGSVVQAGERYAIGGNTLAADLVGILGPVTGQPALGVPVETHEYAHDLLLVEWPPDGGSAMVRTVDRPLRAGVHDRLDGTINYWGLYPGPGGDVSLFYGDPEQRRAMMVRVGLEAPIPLPGVPDNIQWIALPPWKERLPILHGPPGGGPMYLKFLPM